MQFNTNNMTDEQKAALFEQLKRQQQHQELKGIMQFLYQKYVDPNNGIIDSSDRAVFYDKAIAMGLPKELANKFADDVMKHPLHTSNFN